MITDTYSLNPRSIHRPPIRPAPVAFHEWSRGPRARATTSRRRNCRATKRYRAPRKRDSRANARWSRLSPISVAPMIFAIFRIRKRRGDARPTSNVISGQTVARNRHGNFLLSRIPSRWIKSCEIPFLPDTLVVANRESSSQRAEIRSVRSLSFRPPP